MTTLHLGVTDLPYSHTDNQGKSKKGADRVSTTGEVAEILEGKYHIWEIFWQLHGQDIVEKDMSEALQGSFESLLMGAPPSPNVFASSNSEIQARFSRFLSDREMDSLGIPGVPTKASLGGASSRFKSGKSNKGSRPSFIDTGTLESSNRAWVD